MAYWQIAAGDRGRDYWREFLDYGIAFVGRRIFPTLQKLAPNDILVLKKGLTGIRAAGQVVIRAGKHYGLGDKEWLKDFDGWNLPAYVFVDWHEPPATIPAHVNMGTILPLKDPAVIALANQIIANYPAYSPLKREPVDTVPVFDEEIISHLIKRGYRIGQAEELAQTFRRIRRLASYYNENCDRKQIREHETRTFLIVPLLQTLGWVEQRMKIELAVPRGRVDLALFSEPFTGHVKPGPQCISLIETKGLSQGLFYAPQQANAYVASLPDCRLLSVSNGFCYKMFQRDSTGLFSTHPSAYMNILQPKNAYPLDPSVPGCLKALDLLMDGL